MEEKPKRRWLRFSVRTLLILLTLIGCFFSWFAIQLRSAAQQRDAVAAIERGGGIFEYDYQYDDNLRPIANPQPNGPEWLRRLLGREFFDTPVVLYLYDTQDVASQISLFKSLPHLKWLGIGGTSVGDPEMKQVSELKELRYLNLRTARVSDVGIAHLKSLPLEGIDLMGCAVTDGSVPILSNYTSLTYLNVCGTQISSTGVGELQRGLPNCEIDSGPPDILSAPNP